MNKDAFEKLDQLFMKGLRPLREKKLPEAMTKDFGVRVEEKIREKVLLEEHPRPIVWRTVPVWAPVFAVAILASFLVLRSPWGKNAAPEIFSPANLVVATQVATEASADLVDDIVLLKYLDAWTEEDESFVDPYVDLTIEES